jgi:hypothetical protein
MFTTKFRATCAAVSTALTVAIAIGPMTPMSPAAPNTGHGPTKLSPKECAGLLNELHQDIDESNRYREAGAINAARDWAEMAEGDYKAARAGGCAWARVIPSATGSSGSRATFGV